MYRPIHTYTPFKKLIVNDNAPDLFVKENLDQYFRTIIFTLLVTTFTGPSSNSQIKLCISLFSTNIIEGR